VNQEEVPLMPGFLQDLGREAGKKTTYALVVFGSLVSLAAVVLQAFGA
jgi:hypothetical protein